MSDNDLNNPLGLAINFREVDTSRPVVKDGKYLCSIKELSVVEKKDDASKRNLKAVLRLEQEAETPEGQSIQPGFQFTRYMPLQQSDKANAPDFQRDLTLFLCAAFGIDPKDKESIPTSYPPLAEFHGRQVMVTVKVSEDDTGKSNDVRAITRVE